MEYELIQEEVRKRLSEKRFVHSCGVAKRAEELAKIYGEDPEKAKKVGIAHDIAKEMTKEESIQYAKENLIIFDEIEKQQPELWHCKIGASICEKEFGFTQDMKQAIEYHTTGNIEMTPFDKIIYIADKTEENRKFSDLEQAIEISNRNLDEGVLYVSSITIIHSMKKQSIIHPNTIYLMNQIIQAKRNNPKEN